MDRRTLSKFIAVGVLVVFASLMVFRTVTRDTSPQTWYYDLSEGRLYAAALSSIPPLDGIGGERGDGVEAIVIAPEGRCDDAGARRIAYLQTFTDEYKRLKTEAHKTGTANQTADRAFQATNTLVKRVDDAEWVIANSPEGEAIIMEFNTMMMSRDGGVRWRPCKPD